VIHCRYNQGPSLADTLGMKMRGRQGSHPPSVRLRKQLTAKNTSPVCACKWSDAGVMHLVALMFEESSEADKQWIQGMRQAMASSFCD